MNVFDWIVQLMGIALAVAAESGNFFIKTR